MDKKQSSLSDCLPDNAISRPITNGLSQIWSMTNVALIKLSHLIDHTGSVHTSSNLGTWSMTGRIYLPNELF